MPDSQKSSPSSEPDAPHGAGSAVGRTSEPRAVSSAVRSRAARVLEHWQIIASLGLLLIGSIGLLTTDYGSEDSSCTVQNSAEIPSDLRGDLESASQESGFPVSLLAAQIQAESGWQSDAHSRAGAMGIAQFTQDTWDIWGQGDPHDDHAAIAAQGRYLKFLRGELTDLAGGDQDKLVRYVLAGYNSGPNSVKDAKGVPDYPETRNYVDKILDLQKNTYEDTCTPVE